MFNMDPKAMAGMMKQLGLKTQDHKARKITVELEDGRILLFENPTLQIMEMQGQKMYQINGNPVELKGEKLESGKASEDDLKLVMEQANCTREEAEKALKESNGDIAEAILKLEK